MSTEVLTKLPTGEPKNVHAYLFGALLLALSGGVNFAVTETQVRAIVSEEMQDRLERIEAQNNSMESRIEEISKQLQNH